MQPHSILSSIERQRICECGRRFIQHQLTERFLEIVAGQRGAMDKLRAQIPDFFVPVHCPACERRDIGRQARLDENRFQPLYTERQPDAAD